MALAQQNEVATKNCEKGVHRRKGEETGKREACAKWGAGVEAGTGTVYVVTDWAKLQFVQGPLNGPVCPSLNHFHVRSTTAKRQSAIAQKTKRGDKAAEKVKRSIAQVKTGTPHLQVSPAGHFWHWPSEGSMIYCD
eukprot:3404970-Rhodomonas_salina.3